jgi:hypothetical protein
MPRRYKALVVISAPLWLPIAFVAWLLDGGDPWEDGW